MFGRWNKFDFGEVKNYLGEKTAISVLLSELKDAGWIEIKLDSKDTRKRIYKLKNLEKAISR